MARTDNLTNFLTDVATAIKNKKGISEAIPASNFDIEIESIEAGSSAVTGFVIDSYDETGMPTHAKFVGMTKVPDLYFNYLGQNSYTNLFTNMVIDLEQSVGITEIGMYAFYNGVYLLPKGLPNGLLKICSYAFYDCRKFELSEIPETVTVIDSNAFYNNKLVTVKKIPSGVNSISIGVFQGCTQITEMTCEGVISQIYGNAFANTSLQKLVLPNVTSVPTLYGSNFMNGTPIANGEGYIYVPDALVDSFKSATNWSTYADQIKGVSELV